MSGGELQEPGEEPEDPHQDEDAVPQPEDYKQLDEQARTDSYYRWVTLPCH